MACCGRGSLHQSQASCVVAVVIVAVSAMALPASGSSAASGGWASGCPASAARACVDDGASLAAQATLSSRDITSSAHPAARSFRQGTQQSASGSAVVCATGIGSMQSAQTCDVVVGDPSKHWRADQPCPGSAPLRSPYLVLHGVHT